MAEKLVKDPDQLVAQIEASFPLPNQMDRYFGFDIQLFQIALPQRMSSQLVSASEHQAVIEAGIKKSGRLVAHYLTQLPYQVHVFRHQMML